MSQSIDILHVDDDPSFAELAADFLERENEQFSIETGTSASDALDRMAEKRFDCIVSDYDMPDQNGIEFLETVREAHPDLPFILFTGKGSETVASDAISAGVTDYLQKRTGTDQYKLLANRIRNAVEQYHTKRALDDARSRIEFALDVTDSVVFETDVDTAAEVRHGPFERLYGLESETIPDQQSFFECCVHPDDRERIESLQRPEELPNRDTVDVEFRTNPDYGEVRWIQSELYIATDADGSPQRLVGLDTDITERKQREQRLERQNQRLDQFASVVSHDLRNPLNVAAGQLELVREECDSDHLDDIAAAFDRMDSLIEELLTLSRKGEEVQETEVVTLPEVLEECQSSVQMEDTTLVCDSEQRIRADRSRLKQLLENLIRNAVEHAGEGATVTVGDLEDGFYVADDGTGIPDDERDAVFEPGYSSLSEGTGFGLNIVQEIAEAHGWTVRVTDSEEGGARFEITGVEVLDA
ncbi:MAG: response regulator [Halodesulfurarchaeum sp.]